MALPGYDPDDIEGWLQRLVDDVDETEVLDDDELEAYQNGERLVDSLNEGTVNELRVQRQADANADNDA